VIAPDSVIAVILGNLIGNAIRYTIRRRGAGRR
jgi:hypothetical protein